MLPSPDSALHGLQEILYTWATPNTTHNTLTTAAWSMAAVILNRAVANTINQTNEHLAGLIKHQFGDIF
jgi:hypothetical protein